MRDISFVCLSSVGRRNQRSGKRFRDQQKVDFYEGLLKVVRSGFKKVYNEFVLGPRYNANIPVTPFSSIHRSDLETENGSETKERHPNQSQSHEAASSHYYSVQDQGVLGGF